MFGQDLRIETDVPGHSRHNAEDFGPFRKKTAGRTAHAALTRNYIGFFNPNRS